jgi:hypothetical protein
MYAILDSYANLHTEIRSPSTGGIESLSSLSVLDEGKNNALIFMKDKAKEIGALMWRKIYLDKDGDPENALKVYELMYKNISDLIKKGHGGQYNK